MEKILIIEDSKSLNKLFSVHVKRELDFDVVSAFSYQEAKEILEKNSDFFLALSDIKLPDALNGEVIDLVLSYNVSTIVVTGGINDEIQDAICSKKIIDYVVKGNPDNLIYLLSLIKRIKLNETIKVLVVEDSSTTRKIITELLKVHKYLVYDCKNGKEALTILEKNPDIKMLVTDYHMPQMDGFELISEVRHRFNKNQMVIIGMSSQEDDRLSSKFIKYGANDFIIKPFRAEEFYCRISQNIQTLEYIETIKDISHRDYLTNLYNRRYFFEAVNSLIALSKRGKSDIVVAMLDLDHFKKINDIYGHHAGDIVLQTVASILKKRFRSSDVVARFGGEEFCIFAYDMNQTNAKKVFEDLRKKIMKEVIKIDKHNLKVTVSIGICTKINDSIENMINEADANLYQAKETGRNRIVFDF